MPTALRLFALVALIGLPLQVRHVANNRAQLAQTLGLSELALLFVAGILLLIGAVGAVQLWRLRPSGLLIYRVFAAVSIPLVIMKYSGNGITSGGLVSVVVQLAVAAFLYSPSAGRVCTQGAAVEASAAPAPATPPLGG